MNGFQKDALRNEAKARITWGEPPERVQSWLVNSGISRRQAASFLRKCMRRRAREMRLFGAVNLQRGIVALAAAIAWGIAAWALFEWMVPPGAGRFYVARFCGGLFAPSLLLATYGIWQVWLAFDRLIFGSRADGPVTDIEDSML